MPLTRLAKPALALPRAVKRLLALSVDALLCVVTVWLALSLRLEIWVVPDERFALLAAVSVALALPIFVVFGLYRAVFRYSGWRAMLTLAQAALVYGALFALIYTVIGVEGVPRSLGVMQPLLLMMAVGFSRAAVRYWLGGLYHEAVCRRQWTGMLIYGAGQAGREIAQALQHAPGYRFIGFLDDDAALHGQLLNSWRVYAPKDLPALMDEQGVAEVLLAMPSSTRARRNDLIEWLRNYPVHVRTLPSVTDLAAGRVSLADIHELEIEDLLGRDPVPPNGILLNRNTHAKTVLITGAGGSIGSELCRQILKCGPRKLLLVENSEFALYRIHQELLRVVHASQAAPSSQCTPSPQPSPAGGEGVNGGVEIVPLLASVRDEERMGEIMSTWRPDTVYHAAAYKHVPLVEHNPAEGIRNNVWGTWTCAKVALACDVRNFVLISTDKAVRPTNVMGASKRLAEMVLQAMAVLNTAALKPGRVEANRTCFSMVRFGNVLGSSGSVVPLFREQIKNGGPITLTHADITRFFMTIPEAAQLVVQAGAMATGGDVFVLDMGQPVRIYDLARRMIKLSGFTVKDETNPQGEIEIVITGLRPGEKLYEELLIGNDPKPTQHPRIMKAKEKFLPHESLMESLNALEMALSVNDVPIIRQLLVDIVSDYRPAAEVVDWVHVAQLRESEALESEAVNDAGTHAAARDEPVEGGGGATNPTQRTR